MATTARTRPPLRPSQLVLALTVLFALGAAASGIAGGIETHAHEPRVSRAVFWDIPVPMRAAFYVGVCAAILAAGWLLSLRVQNWERGQPDRRVTTAANRTRRIAALRRGLSMQTLWRDPAAGMMHSLIYFPFLVLFAVTTVLEINHLLPTSLQFLQGRTYQGYKFVGDTAGALFVIGVGWAIVRRYVQRPYRIRIKTRPEDAFILATLLLIGLTGLLTQSVRIAAEGRPAFEHWTYIGWGLSSIWSGIATSTLRSVYQGMWVLHVGLFFTFLLALPTTKLRHVLTSPANMYLRDRERPKGAMKPLPDLTQTELETFGANLVSDFTWKQLLDTDACTICGRCTSVCPAKNTGKQLDPREIVNKVGNVMAASHPGGPVTPVIGGDPIAVSAGSVFELVTAEEIWQCTTCRACDEICPVDIEILDKILDMRRYLSLMESDFPSSLGSMYRSLENQENPWGLSNAERLSWAEGMEVPVAEPGSPLGHEYLYWVGCAGSFDDKNKKVTSAIATLFTRAGLDFAVLGPAERCTGDPARRSGNEYLFQMLAMQNVEMFDGMGVQKIVVQCPHCFNVFTNEYPQLGGRYEVVHHSQLLEQLIADGRLDLGGASLPERLVYHDSCYLGRHNDVYAAPRKVLGSLGGIDIVEAPRSGPQSRCCGAGGARMWMEEQGVKINMDRSAELLATGASRIATACPFCYIMLDDGTKAHQREDVRVGDLALHLLDALTVGTTVTPTAGESPAGPEYPEERS
ncbi:4Fe-4S dicluster domain-containing protein [Acidimicrobiaceae bacterium USS-CC1]|uniref:4Fe-4S dicluster domain-containing protein n=1 Tax=Acidiferrimicrobium australe TaxID=2664430 RepID=A0ABW9QVK0_9ACTN|nr:4Fe-4S dicluster domain-containing protein [Acidiferrimicrobium australe]